MQLLGDILRRCARSYSHKVALVDEGREFTYAEVHNRVSRLSNALLQLGLRKGDRVAVMARNVHEFVEVYFAIAKSGFVIVPLNPSLTASEAAELIGHSESTAAIYDSKLEHAVWQSRENIPTIKHFISIHGQETSALSYETLLTASSEDEPNLVTKPEDMALIMYTSGSTGKPKGVIATHRNILANTNTMVIELRIAPEDVTLLFMPLFHNGGLWPLLTHFYRGGTVILQERFQETSVLKLVEKHRVTLLNLVPTMLSRMISHPDFSKFDLSRLRLIMHGGGPISIDLLTKAMRVFGPTRLYTSLGSTEANGMLTSFPTDEHALEGPLAEKLTSVGREAIGVEIRIVNESGQEVPAGELGEIISKGDNISHGYWKMPVETKSVFRNGWLHNGDLGYRDRDGFIFVVDRKTNIVISGGENISCGEVENAIRQHPAIEEVVVIGVPDREWGEIAIAIVSEKTAHRGSLSEAEVISFCGARLAAFKKPKAIRFIDEFPRTALGKPARAEVKKLYGFPVDARTDGSSALKNPLNS